MGRRQIIRLCYLCAAVGALLVLAASLPQLSFRPGRSFILNGGDAPDAASSPAAASAVNLEYLRLVLAAIMLMMLAYFVLTLIFSSKLRWQLLQQIARVLLVVLLFFLIASWLIGTPEPPPVQLADGTPQSAQARTGEPLPAFAAQPPLWLTALVSVLLAGLLIGGIWYFWRRGRPTASPVPAMAQAALADIQAGGDVQSIVMRCYLDMSQVVGEASGIARQRAMTAREFEQQLAAAGVSDEHILQLTRLFEGARYSTQPPTERDERAAVECLQAIVRAYGGAT